MIAFILVLMTVLAIMLVTEGLLVNIPRLVAIGGMGFVFLTVLIAALVHRGGCLP